MALKSAPPPIQRQRVRVPLERLILALVEMYQSDNDKLKTAALDLVPFVFENCVDINQLKTNILATFVRKHPIQRTMVSEMKRRFPKEAETLTELFGRFILGDIK